MVLTYLHQLDPGIPIENLLFLQIIEANRRLWRCSSVPAVVLNLQWTSKMTPTWKPSQFWWRGQNFQMENASEHALKLDKVWQLGDVERKKWLGAFRIFRCVPSKSKENKRIHPDDWVNHPTLSLDRYLWRCLESGPINSEILAEIWRLVQCPQRGHP